MNLLKFPEKLLGVVPILWDIGEFLIVPAIFIAIGSYLVIFALIQLLMWWLEKKLNKHFDALLTNKLAKRREKE